jgi:hypothetical protein
MIRNLAIAGAINFALLVMVGFKFLVDIEEYSLADVIQNPLILIFGSLGMILAKIVLQEAHLIIYMYNGTGLFILKFMATYIFVMAQCLLAILFIGLAFGMGIKNSAFSSLLDPHTMEVRLNGNMKVLVSIFVVVFCHALTAISIFYDHEEDHKYHDYQGPQGLLLCILRITMFAAFLFGLCNRKSFTGASDQQNAREAKYFRIIGLAGGLYLLSLPLVVGFTNFALENLSKQQFIVLGSFVCQFFAVLVLQYQFTVKHSAYFEISYKNSTFLPSGKHH